MKELERKKEKQLQSWRERRRNSYRAREMCAYTRVYLLALLTERA